MKTEIHSVIISVLAAVDIPKSRFVDETGNLTIDNDYPLGVCIADTLAGEYAPICTHGIALVETSVATTIGGGKVATVDGKVKNYTGGGATLFALDEASAAGEFVRVRLPM
jgi:predicted RecA/RadA family phage recombinase